MNTKQLTYSEWLEYTGIEPIIEECDFCDGDGKIECDECDGLEHIDCENCYGRGYIKDINDNNNTINCPKCNGSCEICCPECDGDGTVNCYECEGKKVIDTTFETYQEQYNKDKALINKLKAKQ